MASYYFSPIGNSQQLSTSGAPLNAGTITTFQAGTSTPQATYTDNAGSNPSTSLTLNTYGLPSSPVWLLGGQAYKFVIKDSLGNTIRTIDNVSGVNDLSAVPAAVLVNRAYAEYTANADLTATIPFDDTIPQNTEGTQVISLAYTPKSVTNRLRLRFESYASLSGAQNMAAAIFSSASANAIVASASYGAVANTFIPLTTGIEYVPGTTSTLTFTVRVGPATAVTMRLNGSSAARFFGGVSRAFLVIDELAP